MEPNTSWPDCPKCGKKMEYITSGEYEYGDEWGDSTWTGWKCSDCGEELDS